MCGYRLVGMASPFQGEIGPVRFRLPAPYSPVTQSGKSAALIRSLSPVQIGTGLLVMKGQMMQKTILRNCKYCGKAFHALAKDVKRGYGRFCSKSCVGKYSNKKRYGESPKTIPCEYCGKLTRNAKYCSRSCSNRGRKKERVYRCETCGDVLDTARKYCNRDCRFSYNGCGDITLGELRTRYSTH